MRKEVRCIPYCLFFIHWIYLIQHGYDCAYLVSSLVSATSPHMDWILISSSCFVLFVNNEANLGSCLMCLFIHRWSNRMYYNIVCYHCLILVRLYLGWIDPCTHFSALFLLYSNEFNLMGRKYLYNLAIKAICPYLLLRYFSNLLTLLSFCCITRMLLFAIILTSCYYLVSKNYAI